MGLWNFVMYGCNHSDKKKSHKKNFTTWVSYVLVLKFALMLYKFLMCKHFVKSSAWNSLQVEVFCVEFGNNNDCDGVWLLQGIDKIVVIMLQVFNE
jgi:hypothetical protein